LPFPVGTGGEWIEGKLCPPNQALKEGKKKKKRDHYPYILTSVSLNYEDSRENQSSALKGVYGNGFSPERETSQRHRSTSVWGQTDTDQVTPSGVRVVNLCRGLLGSRQQRDLGGKGDLFLKQGWENCGKGGTCPLISPTDHLSFPRGGVRGDLFWDCPPTAPVGEVPPTS